MTVVIWHGSAIVQDRATSDYLLSSGWEIDVIYVGF